MKRFLAGFAIGTAGFAVIFSQVRDTKSFFICVGGVFLIWIGDQVRDA